MAYFRTDDGHVICNLYPAKSENQKPVEEVILLDYVKSPSKLTKKSKSHWNMFVSYMEATCIDGEPSFIQRLRVFYLKNFKQFVVDKTLQERRGSTLLKELSKYVLTIGLSGFLILVFTILKEGIDDRRMQSKYEELKTTLEEIRRTSSEISLNLENNSKSLQQIANLNDQSNRDIQQVRENTLESNRLLAEFVFQLKRITSELEADRNKSDAAESSKGK